MSRALRKDGRVVIHPQCQRQTTAAGPGQAELHRQLTIVLSTRQHHHARVQVLPLLDQQGQLVPAVR